MPKVKALIDGGVRCIEVTRGKAGTHWHAHLHCIISGGFAAQKVLKSAWLEATGDSYIVDIRACHNRQDAARYMAAYVAKPTRMREWSDADLCEYAAAIDGVRLVQCWGSWHNRPTDQDVGQEPPVKTEHVAPLNPLARLASRGSQVARDIINRLCAHDLSFRIAFGHKLLPEEIDLWKPNDAQLQWCLHSLSVCDASPSASIEDFENRVRGSGPWPSDPRRQRLFEWMPQPHPDPAPEAVARWADTEVIGEPWNT